MNKQQTIDEMKKQIEELSRNLEVLEKSKDKVEFLREGYYVASGGATLRNFDDRAWYGNNRAITFATEAIARKVDKITQQSYKIAQYVFQKEPDYVPDWDDTSSNKYFISRDTSTKKYEYSSRSFLMENGVVYMPKHVAKQLVEDLNNGNYSID